ncbi:MAG TPA: hypothetical protein VKE74_10120, partial [Gemmataceae bacterium]|nr:hypothetical protein [Gemmataceae bacterium]
GSRQRPEGATSTIIDVDKAVERGSRVAVTRYDLAGVRHFDIRPAGSALEPDYDQRMLPQSLFAGAAGMTLLTLLVLWRPIRRLRQEGT